MPRWAQFAIFLGIGGAITGAVHAYLWARLVRDAQLPPIWHRVATAALILAWLSVPVGLGFGRALAAAGHRTVVLALTSWLGFMLLLLVSVAVGELARLGAHGAVALGLSPPLDPERRLTLARIAALGAVLFGGGAGVAGVVGGLSRVIVREVEVRLRRLPRRLDGTTIVQLTDVHVGPTIRRDFVADVVARVNALEPDVIAITGDLVDGTVAELREHVEPLGRLRARHGVYFVTGNHEYYSGVDAWIEELARLGIRVLRNERVAIGDGAESFDLAGVDDASARRFGRGHGLDLERALAGRDPSRECVLLAHQPKGFEAAAEAGIGLQLSGHTHGGQIWPWGWLVRIDQRWVSGLASLRDAQLYVSSGTGYWGPPMRLGAPAEITRVRLVSAPG
ncbi:MAG: metallophosphoesterase [Polyangiaceae bacterium]|nr:metallophosphoesterase [Polyangiaceae bacterium]